MGTRDMDSTPPTTTRSSKPERRGLGDVGPLIAHRRDTAKDDVIDLTGIEAVAALQRSEQTGDQADRLDAVQRPVLLAFATGRAQRIENECFGHGVLGPPWGWMAAGLRRSSPGAAIADTLYHTPAPTRLNDLNAQGH
jgi:hypothetical protein